MSEYHQGDQQSTPDSHPKKSEENSYVSGIELIIKANRQGLLPQVTLTNEEIEQIEQAIDDYKKPIQK